MNGRAIQANTFSTESPMKTPLGTAWPLVVFLLLPLLVSAPIAHAAELPRHPVPPAGWGEPADGLSVRLSADKPVWDFRQQRFFKFSVRNDGPEPVMLARTQIAGQLEYDGVWYPWGNPTLVTPMPLASGEEVDNIMVSIGADWRKGLAFPSHGVGQHTLRFAVIACKATGSQPVRAVSNPLAVEFRWPPSATNPPVTFVPGDAPVIADIRGRVLDDETGAPVEDFWVQAGVSNPDAPEEMIWDQITRAPFSPAPRRGLRCRRKRPARTGVCWPTDTSRKPSCDIPSPWACSPSIPSCA